jgi:hypothetical protein
MRPQLPLLLPPPHKGRAPQMWVKPRKVNEVPFVSGWSVPFGRLKHRILCANALTGESYVLPAEN